MTFQYYGSGPQYGQQQNPYSTTQPQQQAQGQGMNPLQGLQAFQQMGGMDMFGGGAAGGGAAGGSAAAGGGSAAMAGGPAAGSAAAASGGGGAAGGSGAAGGLGVAGPWAALAAVIIGNEIAANEDGRRPEDKGEWAKELATGEVLERDMNYYGDKVGGVGGEILQGIGQLGNPEGTFNLIKGLFD